MMTKLVDYFQNRNATYAALERYFKFAEQSNWDIGGRTGKIWLYSQMIKAVDPSTPRADAKEYFCAVYNTVRIWPGVQRGGSLASDENVYEVINKQGRRIFFGSKDNLTNITYQSELVGNIKELLPSLQFIKQSKSYPWMPVSKILHFVNPGLFPIWDDGVVWKKVMYPSSGAFGSEYRAFCDEHHFNKFENRDIFLLNYILWAAHYIQQSDASFMKVFADWMEQHFSDDLIKYDMNRQVQNLWATAFEFVAIGAAYLSPAG